MEEIIHKMTAIPAATFGLKGRGTVAVGETVVLCCIQCTTVLYLHRVVPCCAVLQYRSTYVELA